MVEQLPPLLEYGIYCYFALVATIGLSLHARIWRYRRRERVRSIDDPAQGD